MQTFLQFLLPGLLTAAIGEWQFSVFLRDDLDNRTRIARRNADFQRDVPRAPCGVVRARPRPISNRVCRGISPVFFVYRTKARVILDKHKKLLKSGGVIFSNRR
jgi:hypothetical protein